MTDKGVVISKLTQQKVQGAKSYIEQRYSRLIQQERDKRQYWDLLNEKMKAMSIPIIQKQQIKNDILHREAQRLRQQRKKITIMDFESVKIIGKGAFGEVRLCRWIKNNEPVAVKKLKKSEMIFKNKVIQVRQERNVLANSQNNPWIVGLKCSFQDNDHLYLVMDYVPGGDMMNLLIKKDIFTHEQAKFYTAELIIAIESVHKLKYIHRDIKPDNILIDEKGHLKLSDFGLCKHTETRPKKLIENLRKKQDKNHQQKNQILDPKDIKHRRKLAYSAVGTPDYVAPEVQGKNGYNETVDWWSLGVILYEMLVGYAPFASQDSSITWKKIQNWRKYLVIPKQVYVSPQANDLIRKLINDPQYRLGSNGVQEIKAHPFFYGVDWNRIRDKRAPNIPQLKNLFDTCNFDAFEEGQPWVPKNSVRKNNAVKKGTQFIGYTYKQQQDNNSQLIKALVDLQNYQPRQIHRNNVESMGLEITNYKKFQPSVFKKQKCEVKEFYATKQFYTSKDPHTIKAGSPKYTLGTKELNEVNKRIPSPSSNTVYFQKKSPVLSSKKIQQKVKPFNFVPPKTMDSRN